MYEMGWPVWSDDSKSILYNANVFNMGVTLAIIRSAANRW